MCRLISRINNKILYYSIFMSVGELVMKLVNSINFKIIGEQKDTR